jgi:hypothetical protein
VRWKPRITPVRLITVVSLVMFGGTASCGDDDPPDAQPATDGTAFVGGGFDDLPLFRAATQIQRPTEKDGVVAASYETETARPDQVIVFSRERLAELGWTEVAPPSEVGLDVWRGDWSKDGRLLEVSASPLSRNEGDATHTQFDLVLHEAD